MTTQSVWFAAESWPFGAALLVLVCMLVIEGIGLLTSLSPSEWLDSLLPEIPDGADGLAAVLGWLHVGKVPVLMLLGLFLGGFAMTGYVIQGVAHSVSGLWLPAWLTVIPAFFAGVTMTRSVGSLLSRYLPREETTAVSEQSFLGRAAVIVQGHASRNRAAQAKLRDEHGRSHYVMVEPDLDGQELPEGSPVLLVSKHGAVYRCITNPHPHLLS